VRAPLSAASAAAAASFASAPQSSETFCSAEHATSARTHARDVMLTYMSMMRVKLARGGRASARTV
jgi:hypothetical protein